MLIYIGRQHFVSTGVLENWNSLLYNKLGQSVQGIARYTVPNTFSAPHGNAWWIAG